jgi:hypothetical protein
MTGNITLPVEMIDQGIWPFAGCFCSTFRHKNGQLASDFRIQKTTFANFIYLVLCLELILAAN